MKINVEIRGAIEIPDSWKEPLTDEDGNAIGDCDEVPALFTAEYRYNEQLDPDDAIEELAEKLKEYRDEFKFIASFS